jgi:hypothetical protein
MAVTGAITSCSPWTSSVGKQPGEVVDHQDTPGHGPAP